NYTIADPNNTPGWFWLNNIYQDPVVGDRLGILHVEQVGVSNPPQANCQFRLALAYSAPPFTTWQVLGHIVQTDGDPYGFNIGGGAYIVKDGYMYAYYIDRIPATGLAIPAVVRAPLADVMSAARNGTVTTWLKYYNGSFSQPGMGGHASSI